MKKLISFLATILIAFFLVCCSSSLPVSKYAKANKFEYKKEQPSFNFENIKLNIFGNWWWASGARAIPNVNYLPDTVKMILKPFVKEHGPILFTTFFPQSAKFNVAEYRKVTKTDVRRKYKYIKPFYETVLISNKAFDNITNNYWAVNSNASFSVYVRKNMNPKDGYHVLEAIASEKHRYYTFICIMDKSFIKNKEDSSYQVDRFIEDIHGRFLKRN